MKVQSILQSKGARVVTIRSEATISAVVRRFRNEGIGALVLSEDGTTVAGIISERDVITGLAEHGADLLEKRADELMISGTATCEPDDTVDHVMARMTHRRLRHLPVVKDGRLSGIVSIGDVVKSRLDDLKMETDVLRDAYLEPYSTKWRQFDGGKSVFRAGAARRRCSSPGYPWRHDPRRDGVGAGAHVHRAVTGGCRVRRRRRRL